MNIKNVVCIALALVLLVITASVSAGDTGKRFNMLDTNNDGFLTQKELSSSKAVAARWNELDANKDGKIEPAEFAALDQAESFVPVEGENEPIGAAPTESE